MHIKHPQKQIDILPYDEKHKLNYTKINRYKAHFQGLLRKCLSISISIDRYSTFTG